MGDGAGGPVVVTAAEMVAGHVALDVSCLDRLYLNGYVPGFQGQGGVIYFLHDHLGKPIASPALFEPIGERFRREIRDWAQVNGIPVVRFRAGEPKAEVMAPYLEAAAAAGQSRVVAVGCAQEFQSVWTARRREAPAGACPQFSFTWEQRRVSVFYVYIFDEQTRAAPAKPAHSRATEAREKPGLCPRPGLVIPGCRPAHLLDPRG